MGTTLGVADTAAAVQKLQATGIDTEEANRAVRMKVPISCGSLRSATSYIRYSAPSG